MRLFIWYLLCHTRECNFQPQTKNAPPLDQRSGRFFFAPEGTPTTCAKAEHLISFHPGRNFRHPSPYCMRARSSAVAANWRGMATH
jgi:hypothetical protein